jgi:hypothetical protein
MLSVLVLFAGLAAVSAVAKDGGKGDGKPREVEGVLNAVAADGTSITIQKRNLSLVVVPVDATTKIERNEKRATLSDLVVGDFVEAKISATTGVATRIEAHN